MVVFPTRAHSARIWRSGNVLSNQRYSAVGERQFQLARRRRPMRSRDESRDDDAAKELLHDVVSGEDPVYALLDGGASPSDGIIGPVESTTVGAAEPRMRRRHVPAR